jgi:hypothetical protein
VNRHSKPQRVLEHLVNAARSEPLPAIDFDRVQSVVRQSWIESGVARRQPTLHWRWASAVAVAVSFFIGGWYGHAHHQASTASVASHYAPVQPLDGRVLLVGQQLDAEREPLVVNHPGVAKWTLAPQGVARIASKGEYLTIVLDAGRIDAAVIPSKLPESFAVEAGNLRVAVHGTEFSVERTDRFVDVAVSDGTVVVGPVGQPGRTQGTRLSASQTQRFAIDSDAHTQPTLATPVPGVSRSRTTSPVAASLPNSSPAVASTPTAESQLSDRPSRLELETALDAARAAAAHCFAQAKAGEPSHDSHVMVRVETQLSISLGANGTINEISFVPPVPEAILDCTRREIAGFSSSPSKLGGLASRPIMLIR